jgi:hypothetical protein
MLDRASGRRFQEEGPEAGGKSIRGESGKGLHDDLAPMDVAAPGALDNLGAAVPAEEGIRMAEEVDSEASLDRSGRSIALQAISDGELREADAKEACKGIMFGGHSSPFGGYLNGHQCPQICRNFSAAPLFLRFGSQL